MRMNRRRIAQYSILGVSILVLLWLLWEKLQFGLIRYFDADEMAYLHWAHSVFTGNIPYRDFLSYVPPGFYYALAPLYWFFHGADILGAARVYAFVVFTGVTLVSSYLFWRIRKSWISIIAGILLVFLPIPSDKFIEIRPDNLATLVVLLGALFHIMAFEKGSSRRYWFLSGMLYAASFLILPKTLPQVAVGCGVTVCWWIWGDGTVRVRSSMAWMFSAGLFFPIGIFLLWVAGMIHTPDQLGTVWYSLARLPLEVNKIGALFPMEPYQFFYPNALLYGEGGWGAGLIANHAIWLAGLLMGAIRLVTPLLPNGKKGAWAELIVGLSFFGYIALFIYGYPMRHEQYLIPIGVYAAWYAADGLFCVWTMVQNHAGLRILVSAGIILLLYGVFTLSGRINEQKGLYTNAGDYRVLREALRLIPNNAYVFDLVGSTIYFRDPYYVSAVPFGQWEPYLSKPLPSLKEMLIRTNTPYVYEGQLGRTDSLSPEDKAYITSVFHPVPGMPGLLSR